MPISIACPSCSTKLKAPDAVAGKRVKCPKCGASVAVPSPEPVPAPVPRPQPKGVLVIPEKPVKTEPPRQVAPDPVPPPPPAPVVKAWSAELAPALLPPAPAADTKDCPFCGEEVKAVAKKCKHCGEVLDVVLRAAEEAKRESRRDRGGNRQTTQVVVGVRNEGGRYYKAPFNHAPHLILDIITLGMWLPIHVICWICH